MGELLRGGPNPYGKRVSVPLDPVGLDIAAYSLIIPIVTDRADIPSGKDAQRNLAWLADYEHWRYVGLLDLDVDADGIKSGRAGPLFIDQAPGTAYAKTTDVKLAFTRRMARDQLTFGQAMALCPLFGALHDGVVTRVCAELRVPCFAFYSGGLGFRVFFEAPEAWRRTRWSTSCAPEVAPLLGRLGVTPATLARLAPYLDANIYDADKGVKPDIRAHPDTRVFPVPADAGLFAQARQRTAEADPALVARIRAFWRTVWTTVPVVPAPLPQRAPPAPLARDYVVVDYYTETACGAPQPGALVLKDGRRLTISAEVWRAGDPVVLASGVLGHVVTIPAAPGPASREGAVPLDQGTPCFFFGGHVYGADEDTQGGVTLEDADDLLDAYHALVTALASAGTGCGATGAERALAAPAIAAFAAPTRASAERRKRAVALYMTALVPRLDTPESGGRGTNSVTASHPLLEAFLVAERALAGWTGAILQRRGQGARYMACAPPTPLNLLQANACGTGALPDAAWHCQTLVPAVHVQRLHAAMLACCASPVVRSHGAHLTRVFDSPARPLALSFLAATRTASGRTGVPGTGRPKNTIPDMEDMVRCAPPCLRPIFATGALLDKPRWIVADWLVHLAPVGTPADALLAVIGVDKVPPERRHQFRMKVKERQEVMKHAGCEKIMAEPTMPCPYKGCADGRAVCARDAGLSGHVWSPIHYTWMKYQNTLV